MTIPYLMNCSHSPDGWCLDCVKELGENNAALEDVFRELRKKWFDMEIREYPHERVWETEDDETWRVRRNREAWHEYCKDTEAIINGEERNVAPRCCNDMGPK